MMVRVMFMKVVVICGKCGQLAPSRCAPNGDVEWIWDKPCAHCGAEEWVAHDPARNWRTGNYLDAEH